MNGIMNGKSKRPTKFNRNLLLATAALVASVALGLLVWDANSHAVESLPQPLKAESQQQTVAEKNTSSDREVARYPEITLVDWTTEGPATRETRRPPTRVLRGVDCDGYCQDGEAKWCDQRCIPWETFAQGEYIGPSRLPHVPQYYLRPDDQLDVVFRLTREQTAEAYKLNVGDQIQLESLTDEQLNRDLVIQPDGTVTLMLLGQVAAANRTVPQLTKIVEELYKEFYQIPAITITPISVNTKLQDLINTVDSRFGSGGQSQSVTVTPEGTIQLPWVGSVPAQGLTIDELKREIDQRYKDRVDGVEVTPILTTRAPRFIYVVGEVARSDRYDLTGPTTATMAISLAGGYNIGANLREIVVLRRTDDWRLVATRLDLQGALLGRSPCPSDEIWLRDGDVVIVPKSPLQLADDFIEMAFTRGIYGVVPFQGINIGFSKLSTL
jgi:polysaccharide export outer membrane protein